MEEVMNEFGNSFMEMKRDLLTLQKRGIIQINMPISQIRVGDCLQMDFCEFALVKAMKDESFKEELIFLTKEEYPC